MEGRRKTKGVQIEKKEEGKGARKSSPRIGKRESRKERRKDGSEERQRSQDVVEKGRTGRKEVLRL